MTRLPLHMAALLVLITYPGFLQAETVKTEEWQIEADKISRFDNPESVVAEGNVVLTKIRILPPRQTVVQNETSAWAVLLEEAAVNEPVAVTQETSEGSPPRRKTEVIIKADWIAYDVERNSIKVRGNIAIVSDTDQLLANEGTFNLGEESGTFKQATILRETMDLHVEGETIEKIGANTFHLENGWMVTCKVEEGLTPPWSFAAADTKVTQGEYATLKHATFRIKNIPVFYTPWIMIPVGNKRQTGVLIPELSISSKNGFGFNLPLFINISDSADLTLYPEVLTKRGFMPGMEFRYTLGSQKKAGIMATYVHDILSDPDETSYWEETGYTHTNQGRYWVRGKLDHDFSNNIITRVDIDVVSDRNYLSEFNTGITGVDNSNDRFLKAFGRGFQNNTTDLRENTMKILKSWDKMALEGVILGINDVRRNKTDPPPLWKLPSLDFTGSKILGATPLSLAWNADYVHYYRKDGVDGQRFDLFPRLSMPLPLGQYLESRVEAGVRDTYYNVTTFGDETWDKNTSQNRLLGKFHTEVGTTLLRNFSMETQNTDGLTHNLRPYIQYDYLTDENQEDLPDFDSVDRKDHENKVTYGVDNFFTLFGNRNDEDTDRDYAYLKIKQSYELQSEESDTPFTPVEIKLRWNPTRQAKLNYKSEIDVYGDGSSHTVEAAYTNDRGDFISIDYRFEDLEGEDTHQLNMAAKAQLTDTLIASYDIEHSFSENETIEQNISVTYIQPCWSVELKSKYTPDSTLVAIFFTLANIGTPLGIQL